MDCSLKIFSAKNTNITNNISLRSINKRVPSPTHWANFKSKRIFLSMSFFSLFLFYLAIIHLYINYFLLIIIIIMYIPLLYLLLSSKKRDIFKIIIITCVCLFVVFTWMDEWMDGGDEQWRHRTRKDPNSEPCNGYPFFLFHYGRAEEKTSISFCFFYRFSFSSNFFLLL